MRKTFPVFAVLLCVTLSACGFQLRGAFQVPDALKVLHLSAENPNSAIVSQVRRSMLASGVRVVNSNNDAPYTLHISKERTEKRSISVDSIAAAAEFQLRQFVSYELRDSSNRIVISPQQIINERNFQNDINNVVGKRDEERLIMDEMRIQLASQIMRRYQAIDLDSLPSPASK